MKIQDNLVWRKSLTTKSPSWILHSSKIINMNLSRNLALQEIYINFIIYLQK